MEQPQKLETIIMQLRADELKMKDRDHVGCGVLSFVIFFFTLPFLTDGHIWKFALANGCLALGVMLHYYITASKIDLPGIGMQLRPN